ncbi:MAG: VWA domain-containing protein [Phycisphaerae bacterium]
MSTASSPQRPAPGRLVACLAACLAVVPVASANAPIDPGELRIVGPEGQPPAACPLRHTDVRANLAGFVGRVTVRQEFQNPYDRKIEAVYVFPLPQNAAVDEMVMTVGGRRVLGQVKPRDEARQAYEAARDAGRVASLLEQERPNVFTQSVANIEPGATIEIEISYVEVLKYEAGQYEWVFPMVVGPRYIPGGGSAPMPLSTGTPTAQVPDADRITPPVARPGTRSGHDISLRVSLDGGRRTVGEQLIANAPRDIQSELHEIDVQPARCPGCLILDLRNRAEIPNRDFILRYRLGDDAVRDVLLTHEDARGRWFALVLQPPERVLPDAVVPRELVFVLDTSGSMRGQPIELAQRLMNEMIATMTPLDTFNVITFSGFTRVLWDHPQPATPQNIAAAQRVVSSQQGGGGTEMMRAIEAALLQPERCDPVGQPAPIRIVCFMTDGYVGNDLEIIDAVRRHAATTRVFSFGVGNSVNRFLLEGMAQAGRGEVEFVTLGSDADGAVRRFRDRLRAPVLTDVTIDWGGLPVTDVYPRRIPDLFSAKPVVVVGRLTGPPVGAVTLRGRTATGRFERSVQFSCPDTKDENCALASLWARASVDDLLHRDLAALQRNQLPEDLRQRVTDLGVQFGLMTPFTSFVAVEELDVTVGGKPTKVLVPVEMPQGVSYEGVFGEAGGRAIERSKSDPVRALQVLGYVGGTPAAPAERSRSDAEQRLGFIGRAAAEADAGDEAPTATVTTPADKLAPILRNLAKRVELEGRDGNLGIDGVTVVAGRVDVIVELREINDATRAALKKLGFVESGASRTAPLLIGSIDVRRLDELAALDAVVRIRPIGV